MCLLHPSACSFSSHLAVIYWTFLCLVSVIHAVGYLILHRFAHGIYAWIDMKKNNNLCGIGMSESEDQLWCVCAFILHFKSIQWLTVTTWILTGTITCTINRHETSNSHVFSTDTQRSWFNQVAKTTGEPGQMDLRQHSELRWGWMQPGYCQNGGLPIATMVSLVFHRLSHLQHLSLPATMESVKLEAAS